MSSSKIYFKEVNYEAFMAGSDSAPNPSQPSELHAIGMKFMGPWLRAKRGVRLARVCSGAIPCQTATWRGVFMLHVLSRWILQVNSSKGTASIKLYANVTVCLMLLQYTRSQFDVYSTLQLV